MCSPVTFIFAVRIQMAAHWDIKLIGAAPQPVPRKNLRHLYTALFFLQRYGAYGIICHKPPYFGAGKDLYI